MNKQTLASLIRHLATCLGGFLLAKGQPELGSFITFVGAGWGVQQKRAAAKQKAVAVAAGIARAAHTRFTTPQS